MLKKIYLATASSLLLFGAAGIAQASNTESTHEDPYAFMYNSYPSYYDGGSSYSDEGSSSTSQEDPYDFLYEDRSNTPVSPE